MKQPGLEPYFGYGYRVDPAKSHIRDIGAPAPTKDRPFSSIYTWDTFPTAFFPRNEQASKAIKSHGTETHRSPNSQCVVEFLGRATPHYRMKNSNCEPLLFHIPRDSPSASFPRLLSLRAHAEWAQLCTWLPYCKTHQSPEVGIRNTKKGGSVY